MAWASPARARSSSRRSPSSRIYVRAHLKLISRRPSSCLAGTTLVGRQARCRSGARPAWGWHAPRTRQPVRARRRCRPCRTRHRGGAPRPPRTLARRYGRACTTMPCFTVASKLLSMTCTVVNVASVSRQSRPGAKGFSGFRLGGLAQTLRVHGPRALASSFLSRTFVAGPGSHEAR